MSLDDLKSMRDSFKSTATMPALFVGHGNPMNAITKNEFTQGWRKIGKMLPKPQAILCISAHWETNGTYVTAMEKPKTIHDFYGFPDELFALEYPAPGSVELAKKIKANMATPNVEFDYNWGLDHGCWSVVKFMYPNADVPIIEMSLDRTKPPQWHYELAKELSFLRSKGVLIIGSGNMVHNLRIADWNSTSGFDRAVEANEKLKNLFSVMSIKNSQK